jgi:formylglycine-generating enzyme required for sulfatase activity
MSASSTPPGFVTVPAGPFIYGPEETYERLAQAPPPKPRQTLELDTFQIAIRPVTYAEWKSFLDATGFRWRGVWYAIDRHWRTRVPFAGRRYAPVRAYPPAMAGYPIVMVSQADALAYCEWASRQIGQRCGLPTEFQWEKAARGTEGRTYPWGEAKPRPEIQWQRRFPVGSRRTCIACWCPRCENGRGPAGTGASARRCRWARGPRMFRLSAAWTWRATFGSGPRASTTRPRI